MSLYTGDLMFERIEKILKGGDLAGYSGAQKAISFGATAVPDVMVRWLPALHTA